MFGYTDPASGVHGISESGTGVQGSSTTGTGEVSGVRSLANLMTEGDRPSTGFWDHGAAASDDL